jgi:regulator of replication initiation timing|tara:strand:- start:27 stop:491 length:465 start_codon:yes stop_codon:yes gene_type:complete
MLKIKMLKIKIILMLIMMVGAGGGYLYVKKLQKDNAVLKVNQIKLETAVEDNNKVIEQQTADLRAIRVTLEVIEESNKRLQADKDNLSDRLGKHDIGNLAEKKPGLVEKIINKASDSAVRCMEIASGSPLTEEELNGSPNRECPSFWPSDTTAE